jgi:hypothetical protein
MVGIFGQRASAAEQQWQREKDRQKGIPDVFRHADFLQ